MQVLPHPGVVVKDLVSHPVVVDGRLNAMQVLDVLEHAVRGAGTCRRYLHTPL